MAKRFALYKRLEGTIQDSGYILGDNGNLYEPDMIHNDTILLAASSWSRFKITDVVGKRVSFTIYTPKNKGYNFKLI